MSGNIKYLGEGDKTVKSLPTSGFGFSISNSDGKDKALQKFASSFTDNKTKQSMVTDFSFDLVQKIIENATNVPKLEEVLQVKQTPLNNKDCSVFTISQKTPIEPPSLENSVRPNPLSSEGTVERNNGEEINSLKEENQQLKEQSLMQTNEMAQKLNAMLDKKQVEIAELQSQLQLKQEGEKNVVLLLEKEIQLLKLLEDALDLYKLRNEIGTKVNMDLQKTINSIKTLLETTKQTREQVSQSDFQPKTNEIIKEADTALSEANNIIADYEKQQVNSSTNQLVEIPTSSVKVGKKTTPTAEELKTKILELADTEYKKNPSTMVKNINTVKRQLNEAKNNNTKTLTFFLNRATQGKFIEGGNKSRKRFNSCKRKVYKNKTNTRRYRKRSFTRRRK